MEGRWRDTAFSILRKASVRDVIYQTGAITELSIVPFQRIILVHLAIPEDEKHASLS
jgi:hypothetical protein